MELSWSWSSARREGGRRRSTRNEYFMIEPLRLSTLDELCRGVVYRAVEVIPSYLIDSEGNQIYRGLKGYSALRV